MNAPATFAPTRPATLAERIVAGDLSACPEGRYTDEEWRREAQCCLDAEDESPLLWMLAEARVHAEHDAWQRDGALRGIDREFVDIEQGPLGDAYRRLTRAPLSSFSDIIGEGERPRHALQGRVA